MSNLNQDLDALAKIKELEAQIKAQKKNLDPVALKCGVYHADKTNKNFFTFKFEKEANCSRGALLSRAAYQELIDNQESILAAMDRLKID